MTTRMRYSVVLIPTEEGFAVRCPALPGCWSEGATEDEALENIADAIREYLEVLRDRYQAQDTREVEVAV